MERDTKNNSLNIGFLTPEYPHELCGKSAGLGSSIKNLAHSLVKEGCNVSVFVYGQKKSSLVDEGGIKIHFIKQKKYLLFGWYFYRKHIQFYLNKYISQDKIDIIETQDWTGIAAFIKLKAKFIIRLHGSDTYFCNLEGRRQKRKNFYLEKIALKNVDEVVGVSDFVSLETKRIFKLKREIPTLYNGIDIEKFSPNSVIEEKNTLLYFGTIIRKKGVFELAKAFNKLIEVNKNVKLIALGKDSKDVLSKESTIEMFKSILTKESKANTIFLNEVPYAEVKNYIQKASVVVLPSFAEAFPMTWLEAMAMEKAMVTSNIGWANEVMIDQETGYTINPNDHSDFANKINILLMNNTLRLKFGKNARKRIVKNFSSEVIVKQNINYYKKVLEN